MYEVLEANERRRLKVLEYLYSRDDWIPLRELAQKTGSSERILKQDMIQLREYYSIEVLQTSHRGIRFVFPPYQSIDGIYRAILKDSIAFNFIEKLFYDDTKTVFELAEELFISSSTLFRIIKKLNGSLKKYYVQIQTHPCKMISENEDTIRYFYLNYFSERYSNLEWPHKAINQEIYEQLLFLIMKENNINIDLADFSRLKLWTVISFVRTQQGNYTQIASSNYTKMIPDFSKFHPAVATIEKTLGISLDKDFLEQVFSVFINNDFVLTYDSLLEDAQTNPFIEKNISVHRDLLTNLSNHLRIPIPNLNQLIKEMYNITHLVFKSKSGHYLPSFILFDQKKFFIQSIEELFPDFVKEVLTTLKRYEKIMELTYNESARYEIMYTLIIHWEHLIPELYKRKEKVHLLIVSSFDLEHAKMIQDLLHHYFKEDIYTEIYEEPIFSLKDVKKRPYDILVTTFPIPLKNIGEVGNYICIQIMPTKRNMYALSEEIALRSKLKHHPTKKSSKKFRLVLEGKPFTH
ncbi:M protein trans-acting positive regulator PRD domain-containing protein [Carnobacterium jeotgali]|uniref:M protein trans-acting positive regulator PRD domain-containing protein n=1 Tax=Carnobacterium jeotgali TaxID=545534 RepID=UPI00068AF15A|nr:M protein trans-acting positive regulator PRD domain-containing protein [Carnobacterium jeotgali]